MVGKTHDRGPVTEHGATVLHHIEPAVLADPQTEPVFNGLAVGQRSARLELSQQRSLSQLVLMEIPVPEQQVVDAAEQTPVPDRVEIRAPVQLVATGRTYAIRRNAARHDELPVVVEPGVDHPQRLEDIFLSELRERFSGRARDHHAHQPVVRIAVLVLFARNEIQGLLATDEIEHFDGRMHVLEIATRTAPARSARPGSRWCDATSGAGRPGARTRAVRARICEHRRPATGSPVRPQAPRWPQ